MSPKVSRKAQPQAGGPEVQPQEAPVQGGSSETPIQPRGGTPESPTPPQSRGEEAPDVEPRSQTQAGPSSGFPAQPGAGIPGAQPPSQRSSSAAEAELEVEARAAQTLGELEAEASTPKPPFQVGDQVLSLHGNLLYEAKCLRVAEAACGTAAEADADACSLTYLIHYTGWNKNWDEWVPASRVFEYSEANVRRQSELLAAHQAQLPASRKGRGARKTPGLQQRSAVQHEALGAGEAAGSGPAEGPRPSPAGRRKRARSEAGAGAGPAAVASSEVGEATRVRADVKVEIPDELKPWLVDDWDLVTKQRQLFQLPARQNVDSILEDYARARTVPGTAADEAFAMVEVVAGIKEYFNVMLGTQLLYKFERPQYAEMLARHPGSPMSQIYGAPHLLRLFVRIGAMLAYTPLDDHSLALLLGHLHDFVGFLAENCAALFHVSDYSVAPPDYLERAE